MIKLICGVLFEMIFIAQTRWSSKPHRTEIPVPLKNNICPYQQGGWVTSRTVPGSIPGGVTGFFSDISPSDRSMALGSTQPLVKMSTRNIPRGKGGRCVRLTSPPLRAECHEIWEPKPPGTLWATPGLLRDSTSACLNVLQSSIS